MPIYEYRCENGHQFEVIQSMSDAPVEACEQCGAPVERVFHPVAVHFKGSGFYTTDYAGKGKAGDDKGAESGPSESSGDSKKPDSVGAESKGSSGSSDAGSGKSGASSGSDGSKSGGSKSGGERKAKAGSGSD